MRRQYKYAGIRYILLTEKSRTPKEWLFVRDSGGWKPEGGFDWSMLSVSQYAVCAIDEDKNKLVGVWKFDYCKWTQDIDSAGTWVHRSYRKRGIAKRMWSLGIRYLKPTLLEVTLGSHRGCSLVQSVQEQFPDVDFSVFNYSYRDLRNKSRKKAA